VEYSDTIKRTHDLIAAGARNDYLADAMAPLQGLSRRFWIGHVVDDEKEIATGAAMHIAILEAVLAKTAMPPNSHPRRSTPISSSSRTPR
jgi:DNA-binding GntR family transcriptional regulator